MMILNCTLALKVPYYVCDLTYKTIVRQHEVFVVAYDHLERETFKIKISKPDRH